MIFQDPMSALTPVHTIGNQIGEQVRAHEKVSARAARARAVQLLDAVGIANPGRVVDGYPHQLSGGMRQRAVIAMALSCNPVLLVADEPTTALDVTVQAQILELIGRLRDEFGSAVILVTHDLGVVAEVADQVLVMYGGRIVEEGGKGERVPHAAASLHLGAVRLHRADGRGASGPARRHSGRAAFAVQPADRLRLRPALCVPPR